MTESEADVTVGAVAEDVERPGRSPHWAVVIRRTDIDDRHPAATSTPPIGYRLGTLHRRQRLLRCGASSIASATERVGKNRVELIGVREQHEHEVAVCLVRGLLRDDQQP